MGVVIHLDKTGTGGSGQGWNGQVEFRADLPITLGTPAIGEIYLVEKKTTLLGFTTYQSGLYIRDFNNGNLNDWRRLNVKVNFTDSEFAIVNAVDTSKKSKFDLSLITASTTRTYTLPDKNGTVALLSDITGGSSSLRNITTTDTFSNPNETLNCTSGTFTVNLPTAVGIQGVVYTLVNSGTGIITLDANGTETINGSETIEIKRQYLSRTVQSDGSNWIII